MSDLQALESWVDPLLRDLEPAQRKKLAREIGKALRRSQRERIKAQQNPDGSPFQPRKPQLRNGAGSIRRRPMFTKIRQAKHFKIQVTAGAARVGFFGRVAHIARVHQYGLRDRVSPDGPVYDYPQRKLLGFSEADRALVTNLLIDHLGT
ncbi:MAG: phage virion morphogenesis protein [Pseudohongiellaceae bacterium]